MSKEHDTFNIKSYLLMHFGNLSEQPYHAYFCKNTIKILILTVWR